MSHRLTDQERLLRTVTEKEFTDQVVQLARTFGWKVHHSRPAWVRTGRMVTALQGHSGLPDLILVRPPRVIFAELKRRGPTGTVTEEQADWLTLLSHCPGVEVHLWRPGDGADIAQILTGRPTSVVS